MPPKLSVSRNPKGQFTTRTGQPPSSLATPPAPHSPSRAHSSRAASSSHIDPPSHVPSPSQTVPSALSSRTDISSLIDPASDEDVAPTFAAATLSRSASPTIPAHNRSRSPSPTTSDFPTSLKSGPTDDNLNQAAEPSFIVPAGYNTSLQFLPALVSRPHAGYHRPPSPAAAGPLPHSMLPPPTRHHSSLPLLPAPRVPPHSAPLPHN